MSDPIKDRLAQRIAARRAQEAARTGQMPPAPPAPAASVEAFTVEQRTAIEAARAAIAAGENALALARRLSPLIADGVERGPLALALGRSPGWLSKVLSLLSAPVDIQAQIEAGTLAPNDYYDNKRAGEASGKGGASTRTKRMSRVSIYSTTARDLALLLQHLAKQHGVPPIRVEASMSLRDLTNILNLRGSEIWQLVNRK